MLIINIGLLLLYYGQYVHGLPAPQPPPDDYDWAGFTTPRVDFTDIPQHLVAEAMHHDFGVFQPMKEEFSYHNAQDALLNANPSRIQEMPCIAQYHRCIRNLVAQIRTCGMQNHGHYTYITAANYCEVFFENCRRGYRVWRIIGSGLCIVDANGYMSFKQGRK